MNVRRRSTRSLVPVALLAVTLAGCANASDSGGGGGTGNTSTIRYLDAGSTCLCSYPRLQAETAGYFADEGLTLDNKTSIFNANQLVQAIAQGQADMALTGGTGPLALAASGKTVKVVAVLGTPAPEQVTLTNAALARLAGRGVTPDSPYAQKLQALKGLKLASAATGSTTDLVFRQMLIEAGMNPGRDVTIQPFADAAAGTAAARQGASDGIVGFPGQTTAPEADGWGKVFIDIVTDNPQSAAIPYIVAVANPQFIKDNPETVRKFLTALAKSRDDAKAMTPQKLSALKAKFFASTSDAAWKRATDAILPVFAGDLTPTEEQAKNLITVYNVGRATPVDVPFADLYDTSIVSALPGA